jgi:DNA-binding HxlR family transcriptional regulator
MYPEIPPRVEYSLTDFGKTIIPVLEALAQWGLTYMDIQQDRKCEVGK